MKIDSSFDFVYEYSVNTVMHPKQHVFDFYSDTEKNKLGTLVCHKSEQPLRPNYLGSVLAIDFLEVSEKNKGTGTKILKFAEEYSKQIGCEGFLTIKADGSFMPTKIPHIFYRKFGFSTFEKNTDKKLDKFIKQKTNATNKDFPNLLMHYPMPERKPSGMKKVFSCLKNIFKM